MTKWDLLSSTQRASRQVALLLIAICWLWNAAYKKDQAEFDRMFLHQYVEGQVHCHMNGVTTCDLFTPIGYWLLGKN